jgi:hypothetical protein
MYSDRTKLSSICLEAMTMTLVAYGLRNIALTMFELATISSSLLTACDQQNSPGKTLGKRLARLPTLRITLVNSDLCTVIRSKCWV